jgi:hypothetical protein
MAEAPVRRAYQIYLYAVCFVTVIVLLFSGAMALFGVVRIALPEQSAADHGFVDYIDGGEAPPVFDPIDQERKQGIVDLIQNGIVAGLAAGLFAFHWRRASRFREELEGGSGPPTAEEVGQPTPPTEGSS